MAFFIVIDGNEIQSDDPVLTGRQVLTYAGKSPVEEYVVLNFGNGGQLEDIDLEETIDLRQPGRERFRTFHSDRLYNFVLDGQRQQWGAESISETDLRWIAKLGDHDRIWLERRDEADMLLEPGQSVSLGSDDVERFRTERAVTIIVNGRPKIVEQRSITFSELLALAFDPVPEGPNWCFTVTYRNGPRENPKGTMIEGQSVRLKDRMVFNVTATDKS